ncbi:MAG TPA: cobalamin-independent methionine synthase II family protein [Chloroflexota bacterium]
MFVATRDVLLPTTIIGSLPRPQWYTATLGERPFRAAMAYAAYREQYVDAVAALLRDQERAGLDLVTDGDSRFDAEVGGGSWAGYPARHLSGTEGVTWDRGGRAAAEVGTIMGEIGQASSQPVVVGPVGRGTLQYTEIWQTAQQLTATPVKFGTPVAEVIEGRLANRHYADRRALVLDIADALNAELTDLARAGCPAVQIEAPWITRAANRQRPDMSEPEFYVEVFERTIRGLQALTEVWAHTCWGNPAAQRPFSTTPSYAPVLDLLDALSCDVVTIENADSGCAELETVCQGIKTKKLALGVVSHRTLQVETAAEVAAILRRALAHVPPERLAVTADCGFGREGMSRRIAYYKMVAMVRGTNLVRRELGLPERPCRAADPAFVWR